MIRQASPRVAHIIHTTGIGGVETAVARLAADSVFDYSVCAFERELSEALSADYTADGLNRPTSVLRLLRRLRRTAPDIVVSSLWRAVIVGGLHKLTRPHTPWVIYLHSSRYSNIVDRLVHQVCYRLADLILCDSTATLEALAPSDRRERTRVVRPDSRLLHLAGETRQKTTVAEPTDQQRIKIMYWGRIVPSKRIDRALTVIRALESRKPGRFSFEIVAPESPELREALDGIGRLPVRWSGSGTADDIAAAAEEATFFLQLSEFEGLSMAVREALALGLVPIVTPVGEIGSYTDDGRNALHVTSADIDADTGALSAESARRIAARIVDLAEDRDELAAMSRAAKSAVSSDVVADFDEALAELTTRTLEPTAGDV